MTFINNQDNTEAFNADFVRNIYVTAQNEIKVSTDFSRGGLVGKYSNPGEAARAFALIMNGIYEGRGVVKAPEQGQVRMLEPKSRRHFADAGKRKRPAAGGPADSRRRRKTYARETDLYQTVV